MKIASEEALTTALKRIKETSSQYWLVMSFENNVRRIAAEELKNKITSKKLKEKVIEDFLNNDLKEDLEHILAAQFRLSIILILLFATGIIGIIGLKAVKEKIA